MNDKQAHFSKCPPQFTRRNSFIFLKIFSAAFVKLDVNCDVSTKFLDIKFPDNVFCIFSESDQNILLELFLTTDRQKKYKKEKKGLAVQFRYHLIELDLELDVELKNNVKMILIIVKKKVKLMFTSLVCV